MVPYDEKVSISSEGRKTRPNYGYDVETEAMMRRALEILEELGVARRVAPTE